jgi:putative transcriptional regulator
MIRYRLREIAIEERWNISRLAEATGLARNTIAGVWHNQSDYVRLETLDKLCRVLKVTPADLLDYTPGQESHDDAQM